MRLVEKIQVMKLKAIITKILYSTLLAIFVIFQQVFLKQDGCLFKRKV